MKIGSYNVEATKYKPAETKLLLPARAIIRRSDEREEVSLIVQRNEITNYVKEKGYYIAFWHIFGEERGQSGLTIESSPGWKKLLNDLENNTGNCERTYVHDVSRLGRMATDDKFYIEGFFKRHDQPIFYVRDDFKNDGSLEDTIKKVIKHGEANHKSLQMSKDISLKTIEYVKQGFWVGGGHIYGFHKLVVDSSKKPILVNGRHLILKQGEQKALKTHRELLIPGNKKEIATLKLIFDLYGNSNYSPQKIANRLNEKKIPAPRGKYWQACSLYRILKNEVYIGTYCWGKTKNIPGKIKRINAEPDAIIRIENAFKPIIDKKLFRKIQRKFEKHRRNYIPKGKQPKDIPGKPNFPFLGLILCLKKGFMFRSRWSVYRLKKSLNNKVAHYRQRYVCSGIKRFGRALCQECPINGLNATYIHDLVNARLKLYLKTLQNGKIVREHLKKLIHNQQTEAKSLTSELPKLHKEQNGLKEKCEKIINTLTEFSGKGISEILLKEELAKYSNEYKTLTFKIENVEATELIAKKKYSPLDIDKYVTEIIKDYTHKINTIQSLPIATQQAFYRNLIHSIIIDPDKSRIYLVFYSLPMTSSLKNTLIEDAFPQPIYEQRNPVNIGVFRSILRVPCMFPEASLVNCVAGFTCAVFEPI